MGNSPLTPDWDTLSLLYEELAQIERHSPGSERARDVEDAISRLLGGMKISSTSPEHKRHDAVRRARFVRRRAERMRPATLARVSTHVVPRAVRIESTGVEKGDEPTFEPVTYVTPESIVCAYETIFEIARPGAGAAAHAPAVLAGLLADELPAETCIRLHLSRSTVDRCIAHLRIMTRRLLAEAAVA